MELLTEVKEIFCEQGGTLKIKIAIQNLGCERSKSFASISVNGRSCRNENTERDSHSFLKMVMNREEQ